MTLLFFDGFDNAATMQKPEWDTSVAWANQTGREGSANGAGSLAASAVRTLTLPTPAATCVVGVAVSPRLASVFSGSPVPWLGFRTGALSTDSACLTFESTGRIQLRTGVGTGTVLATGTTALTLSAWTQVQVKITSSATALTATVYLNGSTTPDLTYSGAAASSQTAAITRLSMTMPVNSNAIFYDDLYVCDTVDATATQGRANNDVLGDLKVATMIPTGVGATTQWTPNTAVANWTTVDESPSNQTDYVSAATTGLRDTYDTSDLPANVVTVYGLRVGAYAQKSDAGAASVKPLVRESGGTLNGATSIALGTAWGGVFGALLTRKGNNSLWSPADVNAAQAGIESA